MILKPTTLAIAYNSTMNGCEISVFSNRVWIPKETALLLDIPKSRILFEINENSDKGLLVVDESGFEVNTRKYGMAIHNRQLCRILLNNFSASSKVVFHIDSLPIAKGCYKLTLKEKI